MLRKKLRKPDKGLKAAQYYQIGTYLQNEEGWYVLALIGLCTIHRLDRNISIRRKTILLSANTEGIT